MTGGSAPRSDDISAFAARLDSRLDFKPSAVALPCAFRFRRRFDLALRKLRVAGDLRGAVKDVQPACRRLDLRQPIEQSGRGLFDENAPFRDQLGLVEVEDLQVAADLASDQRDAIPFAIPEPLLQLAFGWQTFFIFRPGGD